MQFTLANGTTLRLKALSDAEYDKAATLARAGLDICPTCGGRDQVIPGSGMKHWVTDGYRLNGETHDCDCQAQIALYARYLLAGIGSQYMRLDWDDFCGDSEADEMVRLYTSQWQSYVDHGFGLTFASKRQGVGKTFAATQIGKELVKQRQKVYFLDFVQMVDAFCGDYADKQRIERKMRETTLLILDDVRMGISERQNDLYALKFEVVIRHRTNFDLPTIFTTNLTEQEFGEAFERIYSLIHPKQRWVDMNGVDYRKLSDTATATAEMIARSELHPIT